MKKLSPVGGITLALVILSPLQGQSQNLFESLISDNATKLTGVVAEPFTKVFSTGVTGGIYRSADTHGILGFDIGARVMLVMIPSGESSVFDSADVALFPIPVAQASLGLPMSAELMVRGFAVKYKEADISLLGVGLKKNFKPLIPIPMFPDVAAMISYHRFKGTYTTFDATDVQLAGWGVPVEPNGYSATFDAGNLVQSSHWSFDLIVSKKLSLLLISIQPYVGFGVDRSKMDYEWSIVATNPDVSQLPLNPVTLPQTISSSFAVTTTRMTLGLDVSPFPFVHVFGDYNFGKFPQATAGLAISFR